MGEIAVPRQGWRRRRGAASRGRAWRRWLALALLALLVLLPAGYGVARATGYDYVLFFAARSVAMGEVPPIFGHPGLYTGCGATERAVVRRPDVQLVGEVYAGRGAGPHPGVLLLHGSTPLGHELGFYRVLACGLARRGYTVLAMDQRDYGQSGLTPASDTRAGLELADVQAELAYLRELPGVDAGRLALVGHSMGGGVAMGAVASGYAQGVDALIAIGPPRRVEERILAPGAPDFDAFYRRDVKDSRRTQPLAPDVFRARTRARDPEVYEAYFDGPSHVPTLLIDAQDEPAADHAFLRAYFERMSEPKAYLTQAGVGHYVATYGLTPRNGIVLYDRAKMAELVGWIDGWVREHAQGASSGGRAVARVGSAR